MKRVASKTPRKLFLEAHAGQIALPAIANGIHFKHTCARHAGSTLPIDHGLRTAALHSAAFKRASGCAISDPGLLRAFEQVALLALQSAAY